MRPRDHAAPLVTAWINRQAPDMDAVPEWCRDLVLAHARNTCEMVRRHGDRVLAGSPLDEVPRGLRKNVRRYVEVRRSRDGNQY